MLFSLCLCVSAFHFFRYDRRPMNVVLQSCPNCGCRDLFIRKNFPQKLGLAIVIIAGVSFLILAAFPRTFYLGILVLLAAVLIDFFLYFFVRRITVCYRCRAEFPDHPLNPTHEPFELAIAEKYRSLPPTNDHHPTTNKT